MYHVDAGFPTLPLSVAMLKSFFSEKCAKKHIRALLSTNPIGLWFGFISVLTLQFSTIFFCRNMTASYKEKLKTNRIKQMALSVQCQRCHANYSKKPINKKHSSQQ